VTTPVCGGSEVSQLREARCPSDVALVIDLGTHLVEKINDRQVSAHRGHSPAARPRRILAAASTFQRQEVVAMVRFLALYDKPDDPDAFDRHYREVHIPLAKKLPRLRRYTISRDPAPTRDGQAYYLIAELDWDDMTDLQHAFQTPEGRACADDVATLAPPDKVRTMIYELDDALE